MEDQPLQPPGPQGSECRISIFGITLWLPRLETDTHA